MEKDGKGSALRPAVIQLSPWQIVWFLQVSELKAPDTAIQIQITRKKEGKIQPATLLLLSSDQSRTVMILLQHYQILTDMKGEDGHQGKFHKVSPNDI